MTRSSESGIEPDGTLEFGDGGGQISGRHQRLSVRKEIRRGRDLPDMTAAKSAAGQELKGSRGPDARDGERGTGRPAVGERNAVLLDLEHGVGIALLDRALEGFQSRMPMPSSGGS